MLLAFEHTRKDPPLSSRIFSLLVRMRLVTEYPHGGIVENGMLRHSNYLQGLHEVPFDPEGWHVFEVPDYVQDGPQLFERFRGSRYDVIGLLAFILPWRARDSSRMYCFEWMWLRMTGEMPGFRVTPEKLLALAMTLKLLEVDRGVRPT